MTYDWYPIKRCHKRVLLCDASKHQKLTTSELWPLFMGMGLHEWEAYFGRELAKAICQANQLGEQNADITILFSCDLAGKDDIVGTYVKKQENIKEFLLEKVFKLVSESGGEMIVSLRK